jgi:hypothetical protein
MGNEPAPVPHEGQLLIYQDGSLRVQVRIDGRTVWLTQRLMAELYQVTTANINQHLKAIYREGELSPEATIKQFLIVQTEGTRQVSRMMAMYLDLAEDQARRRKLLYMTDKTKKRERVA